MLKHLWLTGILSAFSIFGIKTGLGLGAQIYSRKISVEKKLLFSAATFIIYLLLFICLFYVITRFNLLNHMDQFVNLLQYGMLVHFAVAAGLLFWGIKLILRRSGDQQSHAGHASMLLICPCPVCATVILLNLTLAYSLFALSPFLTTLILFSLFGGIVIMTSALICLFRHKSNSGNSFLGMSMSLIALWFLLTVIIAPVYPEIKAAFAMAVSNNPVQQADMFHTSVLSALGFILLSIGFIKNYYFQGVRK